MQVSLETRLTVGRYEGSSRSLASSSLPRVGLLLVGVRCLIVADQKQRVRDMAIVPEQAEVGMASVVEEDGVSRHLLEDDACRQARDCYHLRVLKSMLGIAICQQDRSSSKKPGTLIRLARHALQCP